MSRRLIIIAFFHTSIVIISGLAAVLARAIEPNSWVVLTQSAILPSESRQIERRFAFGDLAFVDDVRYGRARLRTCMLQYNWFDVFWIDTESLVPLANAKQYVSRKMIADPSLVKPKNFDLLISLYGGHFDEAIAIINGAIANGEADAITYACRAAMRNEQGDYAKSIADCDMAISLEPRCAAAYYVRGVSLQELEKYADALKNSEAAIQHGFEHPDIYGFRANLLAGFFNDNPAAVELLTKRIAAFPKDGDAYGFRAQIFAAISDLRRASEDINQAIRLQPHDASYRVARSECRYRLGAIDDGFEDAKAAIAIEPDNREAYELLYRCASIERKADLLQALSEHVRLFPRDADAYQLRASALAICGDFDTAAADLGKAIELGADDAANFAIRAAIRGAIGDFHGADGDLATAAKRSKSVSAAVSSAEWFRNATEAVSPIATYPSLDAGKILSQYPIPLYAPFLTLPVTIKGRTYRFIVDTGSSKSTVDASHRELLGDVVGETAVTTAIGQKKGTLYEAPEITIATMNIQTHSTMFCENLERLLGHYDNPADGVLGMDVLQHCVLHVNRDVGKLSILTEVPRDAGTPVPFVRQGELLGNTFVNTTSLKPCVLFQLPNGQEEMALIDTGWSGSSFVLNSATFNRLSAKKLIAPLGASPLLSVDGERSPNANCGMLSSISIGGFKHQNMIATQGANGLFIIGLQYLSRFIVTFDFPHRAIYLSPGKFFAVSEGELKLRQGLSLFGGEMHEGNHPKKNNRGI